MGLKYIFSPLNITLNITHKTMASAWIKHVAVFRKAHPGMDPKKVFGEAAKTFKKQGTKQSGGLPDLSPEAVVPGMSSSGTDLQILATTYSGGKKRSAKRGGKKRSAKRGGNKRSAKKRSAKGGLNGMCQYPFC
jgi:hypothetical protein